MGACATRTGEKDLKRNRDRYSTAAQCCVAFAALLILLLAGRATLGYVEAPYTLGRIITESTNVLVLQVETVDKQKNTIVYRRVQDLKGKHPTDVIKHNIAQAGFNPREWQNVMAWAEPGKTAVFFHNGGAGETCIDNYWYQVGAGDWWNMTHAEPYMLRSYAGKPEKLVAAVIAIVAGQEAIVPCMVDGDKNALQLRCAKYQRMKASLKLQEYNAQRDFVDWGSGGDEFRAVGGMPGFTHILPLSRLGSGAAGVNSADFNGDGRTDLCMFGTGQLYLLQNSGSAFNEVRLPVVGGARAACWADYDGDGKPDLLLATPTGPRLFHNTGNAEKPFEDLSAGLPQQKYYNLRAAAWIDTDGRGKPDILLADGFLGLRLYRNLGAGTKPLSKLGAGKWYYAGPFDNTAEKGFDAVYPPEKEIDLKKQYTGKNNEKVEWKEGNFKDGEVNDLSLFKPECNDNSCVYVYRELTTGGPMDLPVGLSSDDTLTVWLNGQKVLAQNVYRGCTPEETQLKLSLRAGKNALLMKICQGSGSWAFYFSAKLPLITVPQLFADVSDAYGLGEKGVGSGLKGDYLAVADVDGDGRADFLYSAGTGLLALNTPKGFVEAKNCGISYQTGGVIPVFGDFNGDRKPDLFIPQRGGCKLLLNEGLGHFRDVTRSSGDLSQPLGDVRCAAWVEFRKGKLDLLAGCWNGPNRFFLNNGNGTFTDATDEIGLTHCVFNTSALLAQDLNKDGVPDVVFNNEGQEPVVLLSNPSWFTSPKNGGGRRVADQALEPGLATTQGGPPGGTGSTLLWLALAGLVLLALRMARSRWHGGAAMLAQSVIGQRRGQIFQYPRSQTPNPKETDKPQTAKPPGLGRSRYRCWLFWCLLFPWHLGFGAWNLHAADWATARGNPQRTGNVDGLPGPKKPNVLWIYKTSQHFVASPVIDGKALYLPALGAMNVGFFHAIALGTDASDRTRWSKTVPFITRPTVCAPAVEDGLLVFGDGMHQTDDAILYCLRPDTGMPLWRYPVPGKLVHLEAGPALNKGRVYACGGNAGVLCLDAKRVTLDGKEQDLAEIAPRLEKLWADMTAKYDQDKQKDPVMAIPPNEDALPKALPKLLWQQGKDKWHIDAAPALAGDFILASSAFLDDEKVGLRSLLCLKAADGSQVWEAPLKLNPWAGPTVAGPLVLVGCSSIRFDTKLIAQAQGEIVAVELAGGKVRWRQELAGGVLSPIAVKGDVAVCTTTAGKVMGWSCANGQQLWTYDAKQPFFGGAAIAGDAAYAADLTGVVHAVGLADGKALWKLDVGADPSVQSKSMVFASPVVHGGDIYLASCNLEGAADQFCYIACLSDKTSGLKSADVPVTVDRQMRRVIVPCHIAPRKLPWLKDVYPLEVIATFPTPRGQKAHETVVIFDSKPSQVHKALESLGLKPGEPARGDGQLPTGAEVNVYLELPGVTGKPRLVPMDKVMVDSRTGKTLPVMSWHFTGSVMRQPDPDKPEKVYGADLTGTLISLLPVTDETVCQAKLEMKDGKLLRLETNKDLLPPEGTEAKLVIEAK